MNYKNLLMPLLLSGCTSTVPQMVIAPQVPLQQQRIYQQQAFKLRVVDLRNQRQLIQISRENQAATLVNSNTALPQVLGDNFTTLFQNQGLRIFSMANDATADDNITINIDSALVQVDQQLLKYQAKTNLALRVDVVKADKTLTKTFKITGASHGPFSADIAVLERDFNQQLTQLIDNVIHDLEIQSFIR